MWKVALALAIVFLCAPAGEGAEVVKVVEFGEILDGIRPHFESMMAELRKEGCLKATGAAMSVENGKLLLILKCTEFQKGADASPR